MKVVFFLLFIAVGTFPLFSNPFKIDFPQKESLSNEDYCTIQEELKKIDIAPLLDELYPNPPPRKFFFPWQSSLATREDFLGRISKALHQVLIDPKKPSPIKQLIPINGGGDNCIVCYASFNGKYEDLIQNLPNALRKTGFRGNLFLMIGGFPNPSGKEIQYCGVPYAFKIFTVLEAQKLGFHKVLWIDSAFIPLRDPTPLFDWISKTGSFVKLHESSPKYILPKTREYLKEITGVDVLKSQYVSTQVLGFDLHRSYNQDLITKYYHLVELGLPFFSCFPEEYALTALLGQTPEFWPAQPYTALVYPEAKIGNKSLLDIQKQGYFFLQKNH